jgi:hypothetical protein
LTFAPSSLFEIAIDPSPAPTSILTTEVLWLEVGPEAYLRTPSNSFRRYEPEHIPLQTTGALLHGASGSNR